MTHARLHVRSVANSAIALVTFASASLLHAQGAKTPPTAPVAESATAAQKSAPILVNRVQAVVNNEPILMSQVMERVIRMRDPNSSPDSAAIDSIMRVATQDLIDDELLVQKAKAEKIEIVESDLQSAVDEEVKSIRDRFKTDAEYVRALKESGFGSIDDFRKTKEDEFRREFYKRDLIAKSKRDGKITPVNVSESEVTAELERSKENLAKKPASVSFRQIIFPLTPSDASKRKARAKIDSIRTELEAHPQDFENIAKRESMDGSKELGGDLGWNRRGVMVPEFDRMMFSLNPGVISPVVETGFGYHIIRVDRIQKAEVKARHILIKFTVDSNDVVRVTKLADSVAKAWRAGANYDTLSAHFHDEKSGEERSVNEFTRDSLPVSYHDAVAGHKADDIVGPFLITDPSTGLQKPVVLQLTRVEEIGEYSVTEMRQRIRSSLGDFRGTRRFIDGLKEQSYVWVNDEGKTATKHGTK